MHAGLDNKTERLALKAEKTARARLPVIQRAANDAVNTGVARVPARPIPFTASGFRTLLKWADIVVACGLSWYFLALSGATLLSATVYQILPFALIPVVLTCGMRLAAAYEFGLNKRVFEHVLSSANGAGLSLAALGLATYWLYPTTLASWPVLAMVVIWLVINSLHAHALAFARYGLRAGWLSENVVIVGATPNARRLIERNRATKELNIVGIFDDRLSRAPMVIGKTPLLGRLDDLLTWDRLPEIDRVIVTVTTDARARVKSLIDRLRILPQRVVLLLDLDGFDPESESLARIAHSPAAYVSGAPRDTRRALSKRAFDLICASLLLVAFSPLFLCLAWAIKLDSPGPVFFRQSRHGFNNQIIRVWKFRSMRHAPETDRQMPLQTYAGDPRITRIGRVIRPSSIDELPQLINVIKGEMSLVGPRPHAVGMTAEEQSVNSIVGDYAHRHRVKPGITGWAQINGSRGPVHTKALVCERVRLDMEYVNRSSFWLDCFILIMTVPRLFGDCHKVR
ncbi:MAG: exopolysaccharide biosynthesis polyprenyl glycosylphosphotransferase [Pseudomonadota bacterium]